MLHLTSKLGLGTVIITPAIFKNTYEDSSDTELPPVRSKILQTKPEQFLYRKETIGAGSSGRIYLGMEVMQKTFCAIKEVSLKPSKSDPKKMAINLPLETRIESIIREKKASDELDGFSTPFKIVTNPKKTKVYFFQHLFTGTVSNLTKEMSRHVRRSAFLPHLARDINEQLKKLERSNVLHFDINPANICYEAERRIIEFIDFGCSAVGESGPPGGSTDGYSTKRHTKGDECGPRDNLVSLGATFCDLALDFPPIGLLECAITGREGQLTNYSFDAHFTHSDLLYFFQGQLQSEEKKRHFTSYFAELDNFCSAFMQLCKKMLNSAQYPNFSSEDVTIALDQIISNQSDAERNSYHFAWERLKPCGEIVERQKHELLAAWDRILQRRNSTQSTPGH